MRQRHRAIERAASTKVNRFPFSDAEIGEAVATVMAFGVGANDADTCVRSIFSNISHKIPQEGRCDRCGGHFDHERMGSCDCFDGVTLVPRDARWTGGADLPTEW